MALQLKDISLAYPDGSDTRIILDRIDLDIDPGETVAIAGESGSGKSTLLAIAGLLLAPDAGTVTIAGNTSSARDNKAAARLRRGHIGIVYQASNLFPALTCEEQLELVLHLDGRLDRTHRDRARNLLCDVGLEHRIDARPAQLSGGERQRVGIARALMNQPEVLLADEPTASLDPPRATELAQLLLEQAEIHAAAMLIVSHSLDLLPPTVRQLRLSRGQLHPITETEATQ